MVKTGLQIAKNMGMRYSLYRVRHELEKRTGILKKRHPVDPPFYKFVSLDQWRADTPPFMIPEREKLLFEKKPNRKLKEKTSLILQGEIPFFSSQWKKIGKNHDWVTNPENEHRYDIKKHWSEIPDFSSESGDIKYVWEKSRFSWLLTIIRNDFHCNEDHSEFVFSEIESWIEANPVNRGPNWRCSQEISLRIFNWCFSLHFYKNSQALTQERWNKIQNTIYWSLHHVYHHIDFSRIAVRNNHAITETLFLSLSELLFPFIAQTGKWSKEGRKWFEEEIDYQIYADGTFLQFSMNYHRVVIQLLMLGISMTEIAGKPFSDKIYEKTYKSLDFLYRCLQEENGFLPNCGANDGAWFFPLSDTDYRDFRPQLDALHTILTGEHLYKDESLREEARWMGADGNSIRMPYPILTKKQGIFEFTSGGYYLIREPDFFTFVKCGRYKDRPSHADNLHVDIWYKGDNVLFDAGSYKYNTKTNIATYFAGTASHNTVMLDHHDQMLKGPRFIWLNWTQAVYALLRENEEDFRFSGAVKCFTYLHKDIIHKRTIIKKKGKPVWIIKDEMENKPHSMQLRQLWHTQSDKIDFSSKENRYSINQGWRSLYYGVKEEAKQIEFVTDKDSMETIIRIL